MSTAVATGADAGVGRVKYLEELPRDPLGNFVPPKFEFEPVTIGPTWQKDKAGNFIVPEYTLGWQAIKWAEDNLMSDENDGSHWVFTAEQRRFMLWLYEIDEHGYFQARTAILQRLKGWGKDPLAAVISMIELIGPCRFAGWATEDMPEKGLYKGDPVAKDNASAWIQIAAVSIAQTQNTMKCFSWLISDSLKRKYRIFINKLSITAYGGRRQVESVTSNPRSMEGNRPSFVILNEALALDTPIPSPSGWTTMGELEDGDVIFGTDGQPTTVTKAHETQLDRDCFEVEFNTGEKVVASDGHWWKVRVANNEKCKLHKMTTREMFESGRKEWFPPRLPVEGLEMAGGEELPIDPYILGLWLGDGTSRRGVVASSLEDIDETLAEIQKTYPFAKIMGKRGLHVQIASRHGKGQGVDSLQGALRAADLLQNKHIPEVYFRASLEDRLALLQGLFDSDGSIQPSGDAVFCNANTLLMDQTHELLLSVGYDVAVPRYQVRDPEKWPERAHWKPMGFQSVVPHADRPIFRLRRKASRMRPGMPTPRARKIVKITEVAPVPVRCITVSAENSMFLAGRHLHATCNTHHFVSSNNGLEVAAAADRNATKAKGGAARRLSITNAYAPNEHSYAQVQREAFEEEQAGLRAHTGVLYDSLEANEDTRLTPWRQRPSKPEGMEDSVYKEITEAMTRSWLATLVESIRGDAIWLDVHGITNSIMSGETPMGLSKRFWLNISRSPEDIFVDPAAVKAALHPEVASIVLDTQTSHMEAAWGLIDLEDEIVMFGDGSKNDDSTALVGCRLSDGFVFLIGLWQRPPGERGENWLAPRDAVDQRVREAFNRFNIIGFWFDPSHTVDDEDGTRYWDAHCDRWMQQYSTQVEMWATKTGHRTHAVMFDMTSAERQGLFVAAAEQFVEDMQALNDVEEFAPKFQIDGHPGLVRHFSNARQYPTKWGISVGKESRSSSNKVDAAVCAVGARMMRRIHMNATVDKEPPRSGQVWGY